MPTIAPEFNEARLWDTVSGIWKRLAGSFHEAGFSFEWHDLDARHEFDWSRSFHPGSLEICLNCDGVGRVHFSGRCAEYTPLTGGFYCSGTAALHGVRVGGEGRHRFLTLELSPAFLKAHLTVHRSALHPLIQPMLGHAGDVTGVGPAQPLTARQQQLLLALQKPPVAAAAQAFWYQSKAFELMVEFLFQSQPETDFFCVRQRRVARERVDRTIDILRQNLIDPPSLEELGRQVGCSPFYLSRTFSKELGMTIPQYVRQIRMERAAELLASGRFNVTEAALDVGYSSLSHFSQAFCQIIGCCPNLYPNRGAVASRARTDCSEAA